MYTDNLGWSECNLVETVGAPNYVYVVHQGISEANTVQFSIEDNWSAFRAGEDFTGNAFAWSVPGNTIYEGGFVTYRGCKPLPHVVVTLARFPMEPSGACGGTLRIVPDPVAESGHIEVLLCDGVTILPATGGAVVVNSEPALCPCTTAIDPTWNKIKKMPRKKSR
jgi:hypothetical protein